MNARVEDQTPQLRAELKEAKRKGMTEKESAPDFSIWKKILSPEYTVLLDCDGVLVPQGHVDVEWNAKTISQHTAIRKVVVSGRSLGRVTEIGSQVGAQWFFAENGVVHQRMVVKNGKPLGSEVESLIAQSDIAKLKDAICLREVKGCLATMELNGKKTEILVESGKRIILTLSGMIRECRLEQSCDCSLSPEELAEGLACVVAEHGLNIQIIGPHSDGNVDCQPFDEHGAVVDKGRVPDVVKKAFPDTKMIALIDGPNDESLAAHPDVFPITFKNGTQKVKEIVRERGGVVLNLPGYDGGYVQAFQLIRQHFLGLETFDLDAYRERHRRASKLSYLHA